MKPFSSFILSCFLYLLVSSTQARTIGFLTPENPQDTPNVDNLGLSISNLGDIDGDGYDDMAIGAPSHNDYNGAAYVVYGGPTTKFSDIDLSKTALDPSTTGFTLLGGEVSTLGGAVSSAGDINGDGFADTVVTSMHPSRVYIIYGKPRSSASNIDFSTTVLDPATTGFTITVGPHIMWKAANLGDINGDGYDDIVFGTGELPGPAYVIYGRATKDLSNLDLGKTALDPSVNGFMVLKGEKNWIGMSVSSAGDVDKDGYNDIAIIASDETDYSGMAYILYGGPKSSLNNIDLSQTDLDPATTGFTISANGGNWFEAATSGSGDINGDGYDDIVLGVPSDTFGKAYVIYGKPRSQLSNIDLSTTTLDPKTTGFTLTAGFLLDGFGQAVSFAGDLNRDGYHDIIVGAPEREAKQGKAFVVYGGPTASLNNIDFRSSTLDPGTTGFTIVGDSLYSEFSFALSGAGDINNDGYDDLMIGAPARGKDVGAVYVVYGKAKSNQSNIDLSKARLDPAQTGFTILGNHDATGMFSIIKS